MTNSKDEPLKEIAISPLLKLPYERYTSTGKLWLLAPWLLIIQKRLRCSLIELMIFIAALGSSIDVSAQSLYNVRGTMPSLIVLCLLILYGHLLGLSAALYKRRFLARPPSQLLSIFSVVLHLAIPTLLSHVLAALLAVRR